MDKFLEELRKHIDRIDTDRAVIKEDYNKIEKLVDALIDIHNETLHARTKPSKMGDLHRIAYKALIETGHLHLTRQAPGVKADHAMGNIERWWVARTPGNRVITNDEGALRFYSDDPNWTITGPYVLEADAYRVPRRS